MRRSIGIPINHIVVGDSRRAFGRWIPTLVVGSIVCASGSCDQQPANRNQSEVGNVASEDEAKRQTEEYERQLARTQGHLQETDRQLAESDRNLRQSATQAKRYDELLSRWEAHADRAEKVLDRWERILEEIEQRAQREP